MVTSTTRIGARHACLRPNLTYSSARQHDLGLGSTLRSLASTPTDAGVARPRQQVQAQVDSLREDMESQAPCLQSNPTRPPPETAVGACSSLAPLPPSTHRPQA